MSYEKIIILYCLYKINGERTIYSILHILNGKKSSQTIQDIHIFQLTALFQTYPTLTRDYLNEIIHQLHQEEWIKKESQEYYVVDKLKVNELMSIWKEKPYPTYLKGWEYHSITSIFWQKLSLLIQVAAHLSDRSIQYIPIQRNPLVQRWLKKTLSTLSVKKQEVNKYLHQELVAILADCTINPMLLISRLTGINKIGLTANQVADAMKIDAYYYQLQFYAILHFLLDKLQADKEKYPLLGCMIDADQQTYTLTTSSKKTFEFVQKGYSLEKICQIRKLKLSTIEDHLIEIILNVPDYPIEHLVSKDKVLRIQNYIKKSASRSLKGIKEQVGDVSYFEIRVVMARYGD